MDASAYLRNHGWRGDGHSLDQSNRGITKPLLVSKKVDVLGVGLNKHKAVSDQWWLRAFDQGLKSLGTGQETALGQAQKFGVHRGGLYANFVRGGRIEGSIGTNPLPTPDDSEDTNDKKSAQHIEATGQTTMTGKRKREAERLEDKRARRKVEKADDSRLPATERLKGAEDGVVSINEGATKDSERSQKKTINKRAKELILEAQQRGIIPEGPKASTRSKSRGADRSVGSGPSQDLLAVLQRAGIDQHRPLQVSGSTKAQKYERMQVQREIKRAAKAYLMGEDGPTTKQEKKRLKKEAKMKTKSNETDKDRMQEAHKNAAKTVREDVGHQKKVEARQRKRDEKRAEQVMAQRSPVQKDADVTQFDHQADEIKLDIDGTRHVGSKPQSRSEERAAKKQAQKVMTGMSKDGMNDGLEANQAAKLGLSPRKLEQYQQRAARKGISLNEYVQRRQDKQAKKLKNSEQNEWGGAEVIVDDSSLKSLNEPAGDGLGFVIDTSGDHRLEVNMSDLPGQSTASESINIPRHDPVAASRRSSNAKVSAPTDVALKAIAAISETRPFTIVDSEGNTKLRWRPDLDVPPDPLLWEGVAVRELPRKLRDARKEWMRSRREQRKALTDLNAQKVRPKARAARKIEARERFLYAILDASRDALQQNGQWGGFAAVAGRSSVPLVKVETTEGKFSKHEISLARTVARRMQRDEKRAERAEKGKGKGWKKRERGEKQAEIERGISRTAD